MQRSRRVLLTGGGSGGHIYPNLAIASELRRLDPHIRLLYIGSRNPLDASLVSEAGIPFKALWSGKLRRYFDWRNFVDPFLILAGFFQALYLIIRFWPDAVFAKGGYVSLPVALAAFILRRPVVLHESDMVMGLSNRWVAKMSKTICLGFAEAMTNNPKAVYTGNPVRPFVAHGQRQKGYQLTGFRPEKPVILIMGGSQGAQQINDLVVHDFHRLKSLFQIVHVTGKGKQTELKDPGYLQFELIGEDLPHHYAIADMIVSRSGANSMAEIAILRKPNILIPLKSSAHNHQALNAEAYERHGASLVLRDENLFSALESLWKNVDQRESMIKALDSLAKPRAAAEIAKILLAQ